jgi:hypothetical protein
MTDQPRASRTVRMTPGQPRVPEPHPADYSTPVTDAALALVDELCNQNELSSGRSLQRFEW